MNKARAINILLEHAKRSTDPKDDAYAVDNDALTAAILFIEKDIQVNRVDANVPINGISTSIKKGM
jgi:hypothetical protein